MRSLLHVIVALLATLALSGPLSAEASEATDFSLRDLEGQPFTLSDHKGKVIVLSFWATWCGPCKEEMPHLQKMHTELKDQGVVILSISTDDARTASRVKPFIKSKGFSFPVVLDRQSAVTGTYNPSKSLPYTVVIGKDFQIADAHPGYDPGDEVKLRELIDQLLAKG